MAEEVWKNTLSATPAAELQLRRAIEIGPGYAPGYVALAVLKATGNPGEAERLISKALQLDPNSADGHAVAGFVAMIHRWDWDRARTEFERAIALDPRNTEARRWYSMYFSFRGEHAAAAREIQAALVLEPGSASLLMQRCSQLAYEDNFEAALASCQAALEVQPRAHTRMFEIYGILGKPELAAKHWILALDPNDLDSVKTSAPQLELAARSKGMAGVLDNNLRAATAYTRAEAEGMLHERAATLQDLRRAIEHHEFFSAFIRAEPMFHFLYGDAEFDDLLRRVGLPATGASKS